MATNILDGRDKGVNFYELKTQLADLGFVRPELTDRLRAAVLSDNMRFNIQHRERNEQVTLDCWFDLYRKTTDGPVIFHSYDAALYEHRTNETSFRAFAVDVPVDVSAKVLAKQLAERLPDNEAVPYALNKASAMAFLAKNNPNHIDHFEQINTNHMNTQNLEFLKKTLLNLGFGEQVNKELEKNIEKKAPEFTLAAKHEFNQKPIGYDLHFKAGDTDEMYFFNKFDAKLAQGTEKEQQQTFYINKGNGVTAKEAFNLMEGRAVYKQLYNREGEGYHAWLQLDNDNHAQNGNKEIKRFNDNYGYDLDAVLKDKGIKELTSPEGTENLFRLLKKGNTQQITVDRNGEDKKYFIAASPQFKTVDLYDHKMKKIKREELLQPEQKKAAKKDQSQQQKEELPGKKQICKNKMHA